jgi:hypothetical protein
MVCYCDAVSYTLQCSIRKPNPRLSIWNGQVTQVSMLTPKAFSTRIAISGDKAAFSFTRSDKVARRTLGASLSGFIARHIEQPGSRHTQRQDRFPF